MIKRVFSMENASDLERYNARRQAAIKKYQKHSFDHHTPAVQIAMISERIYHLVIKFRKEKKRDIKGYRKVQDLLFKRAKLLEHLRYVDYNRFYEIVQEYGINCDP
jgi:small subunit ribosomal protein S15